MIAVKLPGALWRSAASVTRGHIAAAKPAPASGSVTMLSASYIQAS
jgi:hypothetical protein